MMKTAGPGYTCILLFVLIQTTCAFQVASPLVAAGVSSRRNSDRALAPPFSKEISHRAVASEYRDEVRDNEYYYNDDPYFNNNIRRPTFSVAGQEVPGHQILTSSRGGNDRGTITRYAGASFDDYSDPGDVRWDDRFSETGSGRIQGNQVIGPGYRQTGDHMRVTTSNPTFVRTDNPNTRRRSPYASYGDEFGENGVSRFGRSSFAPNTQDLVGYKRQSMRSEDIGNWDGDIRGEDLASRRRRYSSSSFRPNSNNNRGNYGFSKYSRNRNNLDYYLPHFLTKQEGFPITLGIDEDDWRRGGRNRRSNMGGSRNYSGSRREDSDVLGYKAYRDDEDYFRTSFGSKSSRYPRYSSSERSMSYRYPRDNYYDDNYYGDNDWEYRRRQRQYNSNWSPQDVVGSNDDDWPTPLRLSSSRLGPQRRWQRRDYYAAPQDVYGGRRSDEWRRGTAARNQRRYYANEDDGMWENGGPAAGPLPQEMLGVNSRYVSAQQGWSTGTNTDVVA